MAKQTKTLKVANAWQIASNPLRNLTTSQIERLLQEARTGRDARLQIAFAEVERCTPVFQVCIQKRLAGIASKQWAIQPTKDTPEARQQAERIQKMFEEADTLNHTGLTEALQHLGLAAFRGRACIKPFIEDGKLHFRKLENWNVLEQSSKLYWVPNPEQSYDFDDSQLIPQNEVCWVKNNLPVDIPGMQIYLRQLVGEETWSRFIEKQGIPQIILTAPDGTPDEELQTWANRAMQIFEGGSGVLPGTSKIDVLDSARGQDPFSSFLQHQMELISILATGGTLATIGGSSGLGSNVADVQNEQFQALVNQDCKKIANAVTAVVVRKCALSLGQQPLCRFIFTEKDNMTPQEYLEMAVKLHSLGIPIDVSEFKKLTGLQFIKDGIDEAWTPAQSEVEMSDE